MSVTIGMGQYQAADCASKPGGRPIGVLQGYEDLVGVVAWITLSDFLISWPRIKPGKPAILALKKVKRSRHSMKPVMEIGIEDSALAIADETFGYPDPIQDGSRSAHVCKDRLHMTESEQHMGIVYVSIKIIVSLCWIEMPSSECKRQEISYSKWQTISNLPKKQANSV